jgi:antirestriction protein ArdC
MGHLPQYYTADPNNGKRNMRDNWQEVTDRILHELENGALPWVKPWSSTAGANVPCNAVTNRPYSGTNVVLLWISAQGKFPTPRYLTFNQAKAAGGMVRKGEHGYRVVFVKQLIVKGEENETRPRTIPMLREFTVFNVAQCDGLPDNVTNGKPARVRNAGTRDELADAFVATTGATINEGSGEAYYAPGADYISLPTFAAFKSPDHYYNTAFHELGHWTGHKSRLDRDLKHRFGTEAYAAEELVAELTAAFLCAEFSFDGELRHAGYIASWIKLLKGDKKAFFTAASKAQQAADYMRQLALGDSVEGAEGDVELAVAA